MHIILNTNFFPDIVNVQMTALTHHSSTKHQKAKTFSIYLLQYTD